MLPLASETPLGATKLEQSEHLFLAEQAEAFRTEAERKIANRAKQIPVRADGTLACVPEDGEEVAGSSGGDEQMPDEMAITELLGQVKSDPAGVSESAGGQPQ